MTYGYGLFLTPTGYRDGTPSKYDMSPECRFRSGIRDFQFKDNMVQGVKYGLFFQFSNGSFFKNDQVTGNTFKDTLSDCIDTDAATGTTNILEVRFDDNMIDGDPFYTTAGRGDDGSFANKLDMVAFNLRNCNGWTGRGNHVFNCSQVENIPGSTRFWSGLNYQYGQCVSANFSPCSKGIGEPTKCYEDVGWVLVDYDADTTSSTYGQIKRNPLASASMPDDGYHLEGMFIKNAGASRTTPDGNGMILRGWRRATTGNGHLAGTDWHAIYESILSPSS